MRSSRGWRPRRPPKGPRLPLELNTSAALRGDRAAIGIILRSGGQTLRLAGRAVRAGSRTEAAYRAILYGLWRARTARPRHIRVFTDNATVAAELAGVAEMPAERTGVYLQTRAMLNAWRSSSVEWIPRTENADAALAAVDALDEEPMASELDGEVAEPLPLWQSVKDGRGSARVPVSTPHSPRC